MQQSWIVLIVFTLQALIQASALADIRPGDVDLDGQIDSADASLLEYHLQSEPWLACGESIAADVAGSAQGGGDFLVDMLDLDAVTDPDSGLPASPFFPPYPSSPLAENAVGSEEIRAMSFNTKSAGWCGFAPCNTTQTEKAELLVEIVQRHTPDIIGLQEGLGSFQTITSALPQYEVASLPRETPGESLGSDAIFFEWILYRTDRFTLLDGAEYRVPDLLCPLLDSNRYITWARFEEIVTGKAFYVYDLHFCPTGSINQTHAQRLVQFIANREHPTDPVIVMGDFNQSPDSQSIQILRNSGLTHTYDTVEGLEDAATHGGVGVIDYIFVSGADVVACAVKVDREGGISGTGSGFSVSDHWPVIAQVQLIDSDSDRVHGETDNCPTDFNPDQDDSDGDGVGDVCDNCENANPDQADTDGDGFGDLCDNCVYTPNFEQLDSDSDGWGDACDNCILHENESQADADLDGLGTRCDADLDQSGYVDDDDYTLFQEAYDSSSATITDPYHQTSDFNDTGTVNVQDFMYFSQLYNQDPQVTCADSALACCDMTLATEPSYLDGEVREDLAPPLTVTVLDEDRYTRHTTCPDTTTGIPCSTETSTPETPYAANTSSIGIVSMNTSGSGSASRGNTSGDPATASFTKNESHFEITFEVNREATFRVSHSAWWEEIDPQDNGGLTYSLKEVGSPEVIFFQGGVSGAWPYSGPESPCLSTDYSCWEYSLFPDGLWPGNELPDLTGLTFETLYPGRVYRFTVDVSPTAHTHSSHPRVEYSMNLGLIPLPPAPTPENACLLDTAAPAVSAESTPGEEAGVIVVEDGGTVHFLASATDDVALDSPTFLWDFGGGVVSDPAEAETPDPSVSFDVRPRDEPLGRSDYAVSVQAFDTQGNASTQTLKIVANQPPDVSVTLNGQSVNNVDPIPVGPGCPVQFEAIASDVDGIGFESEAGGETQAYVWTFGQGVTPASASESSEADPAVQFRLAEGQTSALIPVSVTAYDTFGLSTTQDLTLLLEGEDSDEDGVADPCDNCSEKANPTQADYDRDGYGNLCDGDFSIPADHLVENDDDWCWGFALAMGMNPWQCGQATQSNTYCEFDDEYDPRADMNASGCVNVQDFIYFLQQYNLGYSGPSGLSCAGGYLCGERADDHDGDGVLNAEDVCVDVWNPLGNPLCLEAVEAIGASIAASCGLGWELGVILPGLFGLRSRIRNRRKKA